jgi:hypothetical protein
MGIEANNARLLLNQGNAVSFAYVEDAHIDDAGKQVAARECNATAVAHIGTYDRGQVNGEQIKEGDLRLVVEKIAPRAGWIVTAADGAQYRIEHVRPVRKLPNVFVCQVRRQPRAASKPAPAPLRKP